MPAPLFILSFRHRDELTRLAENAGWEPIAARRADNAEARFLTSGAQVALVDARGALEDGREAVRAVSDAVEANEGALLVLLSRTDSAALETMHVFGATHFLVSPFTEYQLIQAIRFAQRHSERLGGVSHRRADPGGEGISWRWRAGSPTVELSAGLARRTGLGNDGGNRISLIEAFRRLGPEGRRAARGAVSRVLATGEATAFAHPDLDMEGARIAHHVRSPADGEIVGRAEPIGARTSGGRGRDPLTGLGDNRSARAWLTERLREEKASVVIVLLSVSRYDAINAAFGRAVGDAVLQAAARRIERQAEPDGSRVMVARVAGAEFAILLAAPATAEDGRFLAGELIEAIGRPFMSGDHVITLGSRAGVAMSQPGEDAADLLRRASLALAEARSPEGPPVRLLSATDDSDTKRGERLEVDLRRALDRNEIEIRFQPQVSVISGTIEGVEALARWNHPEFGELGASTLFGAAERSDYLGQISEHVQRHAIREAADWPESLNLLRLSLNITATDIVRPAFASTFALWVQECGFSPERLTVEVTESGLIEDLAGAASLLAELRGSGFRVAIDDFGTGYSSLAYLKALPLDYLKIDKRLSQDIAGSARDRIVVRSVIDLARSLGLDVIAEGVETEEQLALLAQEGCTLYQGYLCSAPLDSAGLVRLIEGRAAA